MSQPTLMSSWQNILTAVKSLSRTPGSTAVTVATLALGIGANTAIFSLLNAVVLRPLPIPDPQQLVALATTIPDNVNGDEPFSLQMFDQLTRSQQTFSDLFAWQGGTLDNLDAEGRHFTAAIATVSGNYYQSIRITPLLGRFIAMRDVALESGTSSAVAVVSYRGWRNWYHGDPNILGKSIRIDDQPFTVIGVEPEGYSGLIIDGSTDVTVPVFAPGHIGSRDPRILGLRLYGRLKPGLTITQARANTETLWPHILEAARPAGYEGERRARFFARRITMTLASNGVSFLRKRFSYSLQIILALVGVVLLIACLNLANLALARASSRQHEAGVRAALGATTWDLVRPSLLESLLTSSIGALLGLAAAYWVSRALLRMAWTGLVSTPLSAAPDFRVLAFTAVLTILSALLFALAPAWQAARTDPIEALRQNTRSIRGGSRLLGKSLLVAQIALSLVLVAGALLFELTLQHLHTVDVGYRRDHLLTMLLFPQAGGPLAHRPPSYYEQLAQKMKRLPGVQSVSFSAGGPANEFETLDAVYSPLNGPQTQAAEDFVAPDFFHVLGMHLLKGREFTWADKTGNAEVAMVSQSLAEQLFGQDDPIGRIVYRGPHTYAQPLKVVGVVNSASLWKVESVHPMALYRNFTALWSDYTPLMDIRTTVDPRSLKAAAEQTVRSLGYQYSIRTMTVDERLDSYLTVQRLTAMLAAFFGIVALLIASVGLYGLMSFHVARRTAELGIRIALGAQRRQVISMVLREVVTLAVLGCILGLAATVALSKLVTSILFGVSALDPLVLASAGSILMLVALLAGLLPAMRASAIDPITALHAE